MKFRPIKMPELMNKEFPPIDWVVKELVPAESITFISAYPGTFKTWLQLNMAIDIATGNKFINHFPTHKAKVLYVDEENGERILNKRLKLLTKEKNLDIEFLTYSDFSFKRSKEVIEYCKENNITVVFMDSFVRMHSGDENSSREMAKIYNILKLFKKNKIAVIISHHTRKAENKFSDPGKDFRGSSEIFASIDCGLSIKKNGKREIIIHQPKLRIEEERQSFIVEIIREENKTKFKYVADLEIKEKETKVEIASKKILELLKEHKELFRKEINNKLPNFSMSTFKNALRELENRQLIKKQNAGKGNEVLYMINN